MNWRKQKTSKNNEVHQLDLNTLLSDHIEKAMKHITFQLHTLYFINYTPYYTVGQYHKAGIGVTFGVWRK